MLRQTPHRVSLDPGGLHVFESRHAPNFEMAMGRWPFDKLCLVRQGRCLLHLASAETELRPEDVVLIPAGTRHRFADVPEMPATLVMVCLSPDTLASVPGQHRGYAALRQALRGCRPLSIAATHRRAALHRCLQGLVFEQTTGRPGFEAAMWGHALDLCALLLRTASDRATQAPSGGCAHRQAGARHQAIARTLAFLEENFTEPVSIASLAAMAGVSYRRYTTLFRAATGETVTSYVTRLRIDFAKRRLLETENIPFSGLDAGFSDLSHFYRVFKKQTGLTPRQFIRSKAQPAPAPAIARTAATAPG